MLSSQFVIESGETLIILATVGWLRF